MSRRDWTEAEAKAWLKASMPKGWDSGLEIMSARVWSAYSREGAETFFDTHIHKHPTLRAACLALVRAAKRAGINVNAAPEPQGGGK